MVLKALHKKAKLLGLLLSWPKTKVQMFGGLLDETVHSIHAYSKNIDILDSFTYRGSMVHKMVAHIKKFYCGLA